MTATKYLVVYDPTTEQQPALTRIANIAETTEAQLQVFCCIYEELSRGDDRAAEIQKRITAQEQVLDAAVTALREQGVPVTVEVEWDSNWYQAVVRASVRHKVDGVVKSSRRHSSAQRRLKRTSDWTLIRECTCPVLLVKGDGSNRAQTTLAALDTRGDQETYRTLNQKILDLCRGLFEQGDYNVHFVSAYQELANRPDRGSLVRACGVPGERVHIVMAEADDAIVETARKIGAGLVVMGTSARAGLSAMLNSNTAEKVLDKLECDLVVMP
ncbi:MAG: universal stress protein [Halioglobus sp.]|nr:universal stress protein [Halioglobus sp.]